MVWESLDPGSFPARIVIFIFYFFDKKLGKNLELFFSIFMLLNLNE